MKSIAERFWSRILKTDTCWLWQGSLNTHGYGQLWDNNLLRNETVHRISYQMHIGSIGAGMQVCHHCDVRHCVNPEHLFLGTAYDNTMDMVAKGRWAGGNTKESSPRGETHGMAKLKEEDVISIRQRYAAGGLSQRELGEQYGVTRAAITLIISGKNWSHI